MLVPIILSALVFLPILSIQILQIIKYNYCSYCRSFSKLKEINKEYLVKDLHDVKNSKTYSMKIVLECKKCKNRKTITDGHSSFNGTGYIKF